MSKIKTPKEYAVVFFENTGFYVEDEPYEYAQAYSDYRMEKWKEEKVKELEKIADKDASVFGYNNFTRGINIAIKILKI